jgi:hypothetical protein
MARPRRGIDTAHTVSQRRNKAANLYTDLANPYHSRVHQMSTPERRRACHSVAGALPPTAVTRMAGSLVKHRDISSAACEFCDPLTCCGTLDDAIFA